MSLRDSTNDKTTLHRGKRIQEEEARRGRGETHQHVQRTLADRVARALWAAVKPYGSQPGGHVHDGLLGAAQQEGVIELAEEGGRTEVGLDDLEQLRVVKVERRIECRVLLCVSYAVKC